MRSPASTSTPPSRRIVLLVAALPLLVASKCGPKDGNKDTSSDIQDIAPPTVALQVSSVEPDRIWVGESTKAIVYGAAFEEGARVWVDDSEVAGVTWRDENRLAVVLPPLSAGAHDIRVANPDGTSARLRSGVIARQQLQADPTAGLQCDKITVQFDFDKSTITSDSASDLQRHLACFTTREGTIRVEGHCDERGTTDYNLALGQRRADSVKRWLTSNGVTPSRIRAVSYGEERPVDRGHNEAAWQKNRRAELFPAR